ncbi:MAG: hypothetical protein QNJ57_02465 [Flavobacteriaceae bacterium]|nr:hypothetical protein [Flavobacteriaceae bacterium]
MKAFIALLFILSFGIAQAQKVIEKTIDYKDQFVELDVQFASEIEVKTWDKPDVYFKASIFIKDAKYLELFELDINEGTSSIFIVSNAKKVFKKHWDDYKKKYPGRKGWYNSTEDPWYEFNYVLYVPKNAKFKVSSINGDLKSEVIEGEFIADLINGDIDIAEYTGSLELKTINGEIDLKMINADLIAETIHGDIYADEKLKFSSKDRHVGQKIWGRTVNGKNRLRLNTINGNMYLRL